MRGHQPKGLVTVEPQDPLPGPECWLDNQPRVAWLGGLLPSIFYNFIKLLLIWWYSVKFKIKIINEILSLTIQEIRIKTTVSYHSSPIREAIIKNKQTNKKTWPSVGENVEPHIVCGMQIERLVLPQMVKPRVITWPNDSILVYTQEKWRHIHSDITHNSQKGETTQTPISHSKGF
jgi:hypothetical protein